MAKCINFDAYAGTAVHGFLLATNTTSSNNIIYFW